MVVNFKTEVDKKGKVITRALTEAEKTQISDLAKQAMGFNQERGDSLSVVNSSFADEKAEKLPEIPLWKQPENIQLAKELGKFLIGLAVMFFLYSRLLKPMLRTLTSAPELPPPTEKASAEENAEGAVVQLSSEASGNALENADSRLPALRGYEQNLQATKQLAKENPKLVANVVTAWVSNND